MANTSPGWLVTPRDVEMLRALDYAPLTARQLEKFSRTWETPFRSTRLVRERLQRLGQARLVTTHRYAILDRGQPENYYLLSRRGYLLLHGPDSQPPTKGYFSPVRLARQPHQRAVSDFVVHTACGAYQSGVRFADFYRENTMRLSAGGQTIFPDASFTLVTRDDTVLRFFAEIDNSTERVRSQKDADSIERKIRAYEALQDERPQQRFRVLFISAQNSRERLAHILKAAGDVVRNQNRTLFYGVTLLEYLATNFAVTSPVFRDHRQQRHSLVPDIKLPSTIALRALQSAPSPC